LILAGLGIAPPRTTARVCQSWIIEHDDPDPLGAIERLIARSTPTKHTSDGGWLLMLSYELAHRIEPKSTHPGRSKSAHFDFPAAVLQRWEATEPDQPTTPRGYTISNARSSMGQRRYTEAVEQTLRYIRGGDIYQANIAHHLVASFSGSTRACFADLNQSADPRLGAMMVFDHRATRHAICSISPELFLDYDPTSQVIRTEPMKGTRPIGTDEAELRDSIKDKAELDMITDLMRNDLGRICTLGSIRVVNDRRIESHRAGVLQATSTIEGRLPTETTLSEIINATFPPGSVTGVPKIRAMQIIDELESTPRNAYCGSLLAIDDQGAIKGAVSIRTAHIWGEPDPDEPDSIINGTFDYAVGAGLVADSDPHQEWAETLTKASILRSALGIEFGS